MINLGNPFNNGIISDAWSRPVADVPSIHAEVKNLCLGLLEDVRRDRTRRHSLLIHGSAGSGKTHLLARFRAAVAAGGGDAPPLFSYVRLATAATMMRRHLRSCLVRDLVRKDDGPMPVESLLIDSLAKETGPPHAPGTTVARLEQLRRDPTKWGDFREAFGDVCTRLGIDYNVARACRLLLLRQHRHEVVQWLKCGELPDGALEELGFDAGRDSGSFVDPELEADNVVQQLLRLIVDTRPLVLCFDQIEALQISPDDRTGFFAFGKLASDLFDQVNGILMITCAQSGLLPQIRQAIPQADYHRLAEDERVLGSLTEEQARELIAARLDSSPTLRDDPRRRQDPLWPLGKEGLRRFLDEGDRTPRRLFAASRESLPLPAVVPADGDAFLRELFERRRAEALGAADDTAGTFIHGLSVILAAKKRLPVAAQANQSDEDLVIAFDHRRIVISVCNHQGSALTSQLKRIAKQPPAAGGERILVRDMRLPIPHSSRIAWELWRQLTSGPEKTAGGIPRVRTLSPAPDLLAALEAVRVIMSAARAGELESHGGTIEPRVVEEWIREQLSEDVLESLLEEIEHGPARKATAQDIVHAQIRDAALEQLQRRHVMRVDELAEVTGCTPAEMGRFVIAAEPLFGVLGDPPTLVFERFFGTRETPSHDG